MNNLQRNIGSPYPGKYFLIASRTIAFDAMARNGARNIRLPVWQCIVISIARYRFHGWQRNSVLDRGVLARPSRPPSSANSSRCLRAFRRRTTTNPCRPIDSSRRQKYWGCVSRAIGPPADFVCTAQRRKNDSLPVLFRFDFSLSILFRFPFSLSVCFLSVRSRLPVPRSVSTRAVYISRRRLNLIYETIRSARPWDTSTLRIEPAEKEMEILTLRRLPTRINCFPATDRFDRAIKLIG